MERDFELFPGFTTVTKSGRDGNPDAFVPASVVDEEFKDYRFTVGGLPPFTKFQIKIDMVGTNQAQPPYIKDLRAIATA